MTDPRIGVVGATGAVGPVVLELLAERGFGQVRAFASRALGRLDGGATASDELEVEEATAEALAAGDLDLCFFSVGTGPSSQLVPAAVEGGAVCIDKSSAFRLADGVPLVVPEVNGDARHGARGDRGEPELLDDPARLRPRSAPRGRRADDVFASRPTSPRQARERADGASFARRLPRRATSYMDWEFEGDESDEESKLRAETRKILELPELPFSATCARVPVLVGHSQAVWVETEEPLSPDQAREVLAAAPSVRLSRAADGSGSGGRRRGARRANPPGHRRRRPCDVGRLRQPPQGSGAERDPDRRAPRSRGRRSAA